MASNKNYSTEKNIRLTPAQERLLKFFDPKDTEFEEIEKSFKWTFKQVIFMSTQPLTIEDRDNLVPVNELVEILEDLRAGY